MALLSTLIIGFVLELRIVNIFLSITFNMCFGCKKNRLIETVLLSTLIIDFVLELKIVNIFISITFNVFWVLIGTTEYLQHTFCIRTQNCEYFHIHYF